MSRWWAELAWAGQTQGVDERVLIETEGDRFTAVTAGVDPPPDATRLPGLTIPGMANAHSHAFHRALRGRTQGGRGNFWTWRQQMYEVAATLDPDRYLELARATYAEMALAGITAVGEFHYLHHDPDGKPYGDPNAMGEALLQAAAEAGIRITLLDTCYLQAGIDGRPLEGSQGRFDDGSAEAWAERVAELEDGPTTVVGAAVHSVRAVDPRSIGVVAEWADVQSRPLHVHVSEQRAENDDCLAALGRTPTQLLDDSGALGARSTAVHATHLTADDIARLGRTATCACFCPTTERDLADGVGPARALVDAGSPLCLGSDSHAVIDLFEEARAVELDERLTTEQRGHHRGAELLTAATAQGMASLGWPEAGRLRVGGLADFVTVGLTSPRLADLEPAHAVDQLVFCATGADVRTVVVGGETMVADGVHQLVGDVGAALRTAMRRAWS